MCVWPVQSRSNPYFILTSNIDSQFQAAGFSPLHIYESHGSLSYLQCMRNCAQSSPWPMNTAGWTVDPTTFKVPLEQVCLFASVSSRLGYRFILFLRFSIASDRTL
jgi:NAD-dependent SIR2 family protein deacetylase